MPTKASVQKYTSERLFNSNIATSSLYLLDSTIPGRIFVTAGHSLIAQLQQVCSYVTALIVYGWVERMASLATQPAEVQLAALGFSFLSLVFFNIAQAGIQQHIASRFNTTPDAIAFIDDP